MLLSLLLFAAVPLDPPAQPELDAAAAALQQRNGQFISDHYPREALRRGEHGRVDFRLTIDNDGKLQACQVTKSSGFRILDNETCDLMVRYARLKRVKGADGRSVKTDSEGYMVWTLPPGVTPAALPKMADKRGNPDRIICKRSPRAGSMIMTVRQCMTAREWTAQSDQLQSELTERLIGKGHSARGN